MWIRSCLLCDLPGLRRVWNQHCFSVALSLVPFLDPPVKRPLLSRFLATPGTRIVVVSGLCLAFPEPQR